MWHLMTSLEWSWRLFNQSVLYIICRCIPNLDHIYWSTCSPYKNQFYFVHNRRTGDLGGIFALAEALITANTLMMYCQTSKQGDSLDPTLPSWTNMDFFIQNPFKKILFPICFLQGVPWDCLLWWTMLYFQATEPSVSAPLAIPETPSSGATLTPALRAPVGSTLTVSPLGTELSASAGKDTRWEVRSL